jgi:hypothetical protein
MSNRLPSSMIAAAAVVALVWLTPVPTAGQAPTTAAKRWNPPRTPDGQPDMQGIWGNRGVNSYDLEHGMSEAHLKITVRVSRGPGIAAHHEDPPR